MNPADIPEHALSAARQAILARRVDKEPDFYVTKRAAEVLIEASALGILAERERCAKVAEHLNGWTGDNLAEHIAKVIRMGE